MSRINFFVFSQTKKPCSKWFWVEGVEGEGEDEQPAEESEPVEGELEDVEGGFVSKKGI